MYFNGYCLFLIAVFPSVRCWCIVKNNFAARDHSRFPVSGCLPGQAPPAGAMQLLPKRTILEKGNGGAASVFNPSMFHYQQALANMQLQQPAFIPTGESLAVFAIPV